MFNSVNGPLGSDTQLPSLPVTTGANTTTTVATTALSQSRPACHKSPLKRKRIDSPTPVSHQPAPSFLERLPPDVQIHMFSYLTLHEMLLGITNHSTRGILVGKGLLQTPKPNGIIPYAHAAQAEFQLVNGLLLGKIEAFCLKLGALPSNEMVHSVELAPVTTTNERFQETVDRYPHMRTLNLRSQSTLTNAGLSHLQRLSALHTLSLNGNAINDTTLGFLKNLSLQELTISSFSSESPLKYSLASLIPLSLTHLTLSGRKIKKADIENLMKLSSLTHLSFTDCIMDNDVDLELLSTLPLKSLDFSRSKNVKLEQIGSFPLLESLNLTQCKEWVTDEVLEQLRWLPLKDLNLSECSNITNAGLAHLRRLRLESLNLHNSFSITDAGLAHLSGLRLKSLNLSRCPITNAGLSHLSMLPLESLILTGCRQISSLNHLIRLPLQFLNVDQCMITPQCMADFKRALPDCDCHVPGN